MQAAFYIYLNQELVGVVVHNITQGSIQVFLSQPENGFSDFNLNVVFEDVKKWIENAFIEGVVFRLTPVPKELNFIKV